MAEAMTRCPSPQRLADYGLGKLSDAQLARIARHLEGCDRCRQAVEDQPPAPDTFIGQLRATAAMGGTMLPVPLPAASRTDTPLPGRTSAAEDSPEGVPAELSRLSKYEILGKVGQGGMGAVYKTRQTLLNRVVALKVLSPDAVRSSAARARFLQEMRAVGQLDHKHIVPARDADCVGDLLVLAMDYVEGVSLDRLVAQKGPLPVGFACHCVAQATLGLQHAFEKGMVHRDIKPGNLMVTAKERQVKVLDFGLARLPRGQGEKRHQAHTFMGTPEYAAPEQATDARNADIRSDVYSLGCTLYFLLAGRPPFREDSPLATILAHVEKTPPPLAELRPEVPAKLAAVVAGMMARGPARRYQQPDEVAQALAGFCDTRAVGAVAEPAPVAGGRTRSEYHRRRGSGCSAARRWRWHS